MTFTITLTPIPNAYVIPMPVEPWRLALYAAVQFGGDVSLPFLRVAPKEIPVFVRFPDADKWDALAWLLEHQFEIETAVRAEMLFPRTWN